MRYVYLILIMDSIHTDKVLLDSIEMISLMDLLLIVNVTHTYLRRYDITTSIIPVTGIIRVFLYCLHNI